MISPYTRLPSSAYHSNCAAAPASSPLASARVFPSSIVNARAIGSIRSRIRPAIRIRNWPRSYAVAAAQAGIARPAAVSARAVSSRSPNGTVAMGSAVAGSMTSISRPEAASVHFPSMNCWYVPLGSNAARGGDAITVAITCSPVLFAIACRHICGSRVEADHGRPYSIRQPRQGDRISIRASGLGPVGAAEVEITPEIGLEDMLRVEPTPSPPVVRRTRPPAEQSQAVAQLCL